MLQRTTAMILPLAGLLALTGCLDVQQDVWVNPDGTGRLRIDMGLSENLSEPAEGVEAVTGNEMVRDFQEIQRRIKDDPRIRQIYVENYARGGYDRAAVDILVHDWRDLPAINDLVLDTNVRTGADLDRHLRFTLQEEADGKIYYRHPPESGLVPPSPADPDEAAGDLADTMGQAVAHAMYRDAALTVTLHSPTISRTNGAWQFDKSSVRWTVRMADLVRKGTDGGFVAEIGPSARSSHFWRVVGILLTVTLLVLLLAWFRRGRGEKEGIEPVR